ncbi:sarcosine oxidase subunit gamma [Terrabacter sp. MAHUQ-38]|uniref:sarcosine oxidase subunit gamma n=1 Tax=unclassified Terrabacter TaxID=2630222 RepID=UPI00165D35AE|nr:sarcosine oxidase subunit gamma family protein [Terrabacter sp. MAHUQ-38]MBC9821130.1 sarcosine oxidase subunit gamma [Terrabacter sp. MAHUQ-38]
MAEPTITAPATTDRTTDPSTSNDAMSDDRASTETVSPLRHRRSPGADLTGLMAAGSRTTVSLRELPFATHLALRAGSAPAMEALGRALGAPLPERVGTVSSGERGPGRPVDVIWLGPDEWLAVLGDEAVTGENGRQVVDAVSAALDGQRGQVVDVSANRATLELSGPRARAVLDKVIQLDLHPREFPVGRAVSTLLESVQVILWRSGEDTWLVMPRASFTEFVTRWLLDGMREFD